MYSHDEPWSQICRLTTQVIGRGGWFKPPRDSANVLLADDCNRSTTNNDRSVATLLVAGALLRPRSPPEIVSPVVFSRVAAILLSVRSHGSGREMGRLADLRAVGL